MFVSERAVRSVAVREPEAFTEFSSGIWSVLCISRITLNKVQDRPVTVPYNEDEGDARSLIYRV